MRGEEGEVVRGTGFWKTLPGVLTGIAALITALVGAYALLRTPGPAATAGPVRPAGSGQTPPAPRPQPTPTARFRIVEVTLRADPFTYAGPCPVTIQFSGRVSVAGGSGTVAYKFLRSDGASAPVQSVRFDGPGSQSVATTWRLGRDYSGWQQVQVLDPAEQLSDRATFTVRCR